jgi:hypothetical protein
VDGVIWSAAPPALPCSLRLFRFTSKEREREGQCLVRSPSSIEYRYSPSPSPSSVFFLFFFFFEKFVLDCVLFFLCVAPPHMPSSFFFPFFLFFIIFPFLRLASRLIHCSLQRRPPTRSWSRIHIVPYRTILQYVSSSLSNRLTNQPSLRNLDGRYSTVRVYI